MVIDELFITLPIAVLVAAGCMLFFANVDQRAKADQTLIQVGKSVASEASLPGSNPFKGGYRSEKRDGQQVIAIDGLPKDACFYIALAKQVPGAELKSVAIEAIGINGQPVADHTLTPVFLDKTCEAEGNVVALSVRKVSP
jgi:hypothetical protein